MKKLISIVALSSVALAACGGSANSLAATVDGTEITVGDVESLINVDGEAVTKEQFAQFLAFAIQWEVIGEAASNDYQIEITDEEITAEADRIFNDFGTGQSREDFLSERGVSEEFLRRIGRQGLIDTTIREILTERIPDPSPEDIEAQRLTFLAPLTTACVSHILISDEEVAAETLQRLDDGEVFGELATELSEDPGSASNNGILPCGTLDGYVVPFRDAALVATVGEVYPELVESQFGYHIVLVTDRDEVPEDQLPTEQDLIDGVKAQAVNNELESWFLARVAEADVTVEEQYGVWQASPPTVIPPQS